MPHHNAVLWISPNSWVTHRTTHGGKLGRPNHFLIARIVLTVKIFKRHLHVFCLIWDEYRNTRPRFNHVPTYRGLVRPSGDFGGHIVSPEQLVINGSHLDWATSYPQHWQWCLHCKRRGMAPFCCLCLHQCPLTYLMMLSDWTMSCLAWPPHARHSRWPEVKTSHGSY